MGERAWFRELMADPDPGSRLDRMARQSRAVKDRAGPLLVVIRDGAAVDADTLRAVGSDWLPVLFVTVGTLATA